MALLLCMTGCATEPAQTYSEPQRVFPELKKPPSDPHAVVNVYDPLEPFNRSMYNFNARFDRYVFLPVLRGYEFITPDIAQTGVTNFFNNLREVNNLINNVLQGEVIDSSVTFGRFLINSTVGVLGVWDPATKMGLFVREEDFGQTLGKWGVGSGPYLVLPLFGPSSVRDASGLAFDYASNYQVDLLDLDDANRDAVRFSVTALQSIDERQANKFRYYETGSPFEYELIRYMYTQMRDIEVEK
jgi:phospholipid-binding lipoprotein MlaA